MATVPYKPYSEVPASQQAEPNVEIPTPGAAFGTSIAESIQGFGRQLERSGDELFARAVAMQQLENDNIAKEADTKLSIDVGERYAQYRTLQGQAAVQGYRPFQEDIEKLRKDYANAMPNPDARRRFEAGARGTVARTLSSSVFHMATEQKQHTISTSDGRVTGAINSALADPTEANYQHALRVIREETLGDGRWAHGWSQQEAEGKMVERTSLLVTERINGLVKRDPAAAQEFHKQNLHLIKGTDQDRASNTVRMGLHQQGAQMIAAKLNPIPTEEDPGPTRREKEEAAAAAARRLNPNDPLLEAEARRQTGIVHERNKAILREDRQDRLNVMYGALNGEYGKPPRTLDEFLASNPLVSGGWDNTNEKDRRMIMNLIAQNARGVTKATWEGLQRYRELKSWSTDENKAADFLAIDLNEETESGMSRGELKQLSDLQIRMRRQPEADPQLTKAMNALGPMLNSPEINISRTANATQYHQFRGALQDALVVEQRTKTTPLNNEDFQRIGRNLLREIGGRPPPSREGAVWGFDQFRHFIFGTGGTAPYLKDPTAEQLESWRQTMQGRGVAVTPQLEADFRRDWRAREYQKLFGRSKSQ